MLHKPSPDVLFAMWGCCWWAAPWLNHLDNSLRVANKQLRKINLRFEAKYLSSQLIKSMANGRAQGNSFNQLCLTMHL